MGYTHYWSNVEVTPAILEDAQKIIATSPVSVSGWDGEGEPELLLLEIRLNGTGDESCETFALTNDKESNFCKTNHQPYDEIVVAILVSVIQHLPDATVGSDGDKSDWERGIALYEEATGVKAVGPYTHF